IHGLYLRSYHSKAGAVPQVGTTSYFFRPNLPVSFAWPIALALIMYPAREALAPLASSPSTFSPYRAKLYRFGWSPAVGHGAPQPVPPKSVSMCTQPKGSLEPSALPASFLSWVVPAGMLMTSQCHQPAPPVGASGSCTSSARLFVASGAPDHPSAGDMFSPEQPKPLNTCSIAIGPFGRMSGLTSLNGARAAPSFFLAAMVPPSEMAERRLYPSGTPGAFIMPRSLHFDEFRAEDECLR